MVYQLGHQEAKALVEKYSINIPRGMLITSRSDIAKSLDIGYPQVMKVVSKNVIHKTDAGGVITDIHDLEEGKSAFNAILMNVKGKKPDAKIDGVLVQKMAKGTEVIIGMKRDKQFGPVILFGLGGIFVEIMEDVSMHIAQVDQKQALDMIKRIKGISLLMGARGRKPADIDKLAEIIVNISRLSEREKEIEEIDLNPVMVDGNNINIIDVRILKC